MDIGDIDYRKEIVLVVDDEDFIREPVCEMLGHLGFQVDEAPNGKKAIDKLNKNPFTILLTDIKMPVMDGIKLIERTRIEFPHVCTVAMTGYSKEYRYIDVVNAGATDFINKPFGIEELEAKLKRAVIERKVKEELNRLSISDSLTGLYNQRHFYDRLKDEITRSERQKNQLALIFLDLDGFKKFNDTMGHLAGDEILQKVGSIIKACIREGVDSGYRYGGDEFAIILIDADEDIGQSIGKRILKAINKECGITASIGEANFLEGMTPEDLVDKADKVLYKVKAMKKGRENIKTSDMENSN
ncbi:MAG: diguanylate cyclase [Desulfatiglans sp.]|jgi:diguanylate cyclase (GGDEF)-like protein|nr:diguanylate cyclase [Thermodesulfobacteriota bacterium]MEE4352109.1 diguanylate cyclase [Desulfatiglans sp.]